MSNNNTLLVPNGLGDLLQLYIDPRYVIYVSLKLYGSPFRIVLSFEALPVLLVSKFI